MAESVDSTDVILTGRVEAIAMRYPRLAWMLLRYLVDENHYDRDYVRDYGVRIRFRVSEFWKGDEAEVTTVFTGRGSGDCGYEFTQGSEYLVFGYRGPSGELQTGICSRTKPIAEASEELAFLAGSSQRPTPR